MSIRAECGECFEQYDVKDQFAGKSLRCKACGERFVVPDVSEFDDEFDDGFDDEFDDRFDEPHGSGTRQRGRSGPTNRRRSNQKLWTFAAITVAVAVVFVGGIYVTWNEHGIAFNGDADRAHNPAVAGSKPVVAPLGPDDPFPFAAVPVPNFPELGNPLRRLPTGQTLYFVQFNRVPQPNPGAGSSMKMRIYLPSGEHQPGSLGCVLVAPAGSNLLVGNDMDADDYHDETLPYAQAGMAVVFYSIDGGVGDLETASNFAFLAGYKKFKAACAGVVNGRNALEFVLAKMPQVDPNRIYCAGHSSAATLSLLLAQHEPRLAACIAYAPATDVELRLKDILDSPSSRFFPGLPDFVHRSSPTTHIGRFDCPIFLFHARDDSNEPFATTQVFAGRLKQAAKNVTFVPVSTGDHYQSMVDQGIPKAIAWLKQLPSESGH